MIRALLLLVFVALTTTSAIAQSPSPSPDVVRERIHELRVARLTRVLSLTANEAVAINRILRDADVEFAALTREARSKRQAARRAMKRGDDAEINRFLDELIELRKKRHELFAARFAKVREHLPARKAARFFVALPRIDRLIRARMREALGK